MIKGLYAAVSGMIQNAARQQTLSHNISNLDTPGFKEILSTAQDFMHTSVQYSPGNLLKTNLTNIGTLGLGTQYGPEFVDFTQGGLETTGNPYDLAIDGNGLFTVKTPQGTRYTRDGRFLRNAQNNLVTVDGYSVLNQAGQPIKLPDGTIAVAQDGTIAVNGAAVTKLGLAVFTNPKVDLVRDTGNLFTSSAKSNGKDPGVISQGCLESSNTDPTQVMTQLVEVARSYEADQQMVQNEDQLTGKTISSLGQIG
jgi:flagellar basal body rod protein FlgG